VNCITNNDGYQPFYQLLQVWTRAISHLPVSINAFLHQENHLYPPSPILDDFSLA